ncbi:hypothetical protein LAUMK13_02531 [Mycobacterium innocens]|uniref:Uncharacterized protein n=1 Tax=Mycobacterium innocens TaxID=2341083 RepID=A0A498Q4M2_9MYCO|nr:hypothetical protein LAUMK13_02531 [Mycobacterium innocens]
MERQTPKTAARRSSSKAAVKKAVARATKASAKLENREVPAGYVRPAAIARYIASRQSPKR